MCIGRRLLFAAPVVVAAALALVPNARADEARSPVFLRMGVGPGAALGTVSETSESGWLYGGAVSGELAIGGRVRPEVVVGGAAYITIAISPTYEVSHPPPYLPSRRVDTVGNHYLVALGPFVDGQLDPRGHLRIHGALLVAGFSRTGARSTVGNYDYLDIGSDTGGVGIGAAFGASWILDKGVDWNIELVARLEYLHAAMFSKVPNTFNFFLPSLLLAVTYH